MLLKRERLTCPKCRVKLHFELFMGMRVIENDLLKAKCPKCVEYYEMPKKSKKTTKKEMKNGYKGL